MSQFAYEKMPKLKRKRTIIIKLIVIIDLQESTKSINFILAAAATTASPSFSVIFNVMTSSSATTTVKYIKT